MKSNKKENKTLTFEQMMALFAETRALIDKNAQEAEKRQKDFEKSHQETEKRRELTRQETEKLQIEAEKRREEAEKRREEVLKEIDILHKENEKMIKNLGREIGNLGNAFGKYTEGLLGPSIRKILKQKLGMDTVVRNAESTKQKNNYEIDYLGTVNGDTNKAILVEVKSNLQDKHVEQLKKMIDKFYIAFPEHKGKAVYGAIAAVNYEDELKEKILENGFYFMNIKDEVAHLDIPKNFEPRAF